MPVEVQLGTAPQVIRSQFSSTTTVLTAPPLSASPEKEAPLRHTSTMNRPEDAPCLNPACPFVARNNPAKGSFWSACGGIALARKMRENLEADLFNALG